LCSPFSSQTTLHRRGLRLFIPVTSPVHIAAPPPDFLMESTLEAAVSSYPHVVSRISSDALACSFPRAASRVYVVRPALALPCPCRIQNVDVCEQEASAASTRLPSCACECANGDCGDLHQTCCVTHVAQVTGVVIRREKINIPLPRQLLQRVHDARCSSCRASSCCTITTVQRSLDIRRWRAQ
jgi:hypothetical protein